MDKIDINIPFYSITIVDGREKTQPVIVRNKF